jgi:glycine/D-amino acid oxidase-like deaminating enzyme
VKSYDVAVIGAGVFGSWTAWHLAGAGKSVLLVDAWGAAHSRSSSGGESRIIRMGYGPDEIYTRMSMRSLAAWRDLFQRAGQPLFHRTGVLWMARADHPHNVDTLRVFAAAGVPHEVVTHSELARRYPQIRMSSAEIFGIFEPESGALMARRAVAAVVEDAARGAADYRIQSVAWPDPPIDAGTLVFACGPWLPKLFPELLAARIFTTRQEVFFFAPPAGDCRFSPPDLPIWLDYTDPRGPYGFPNLENRGFKLAFDRHGGAFDPDGGDRNVSAEGIAAARTFLAERFPALANAPLTESRVCQYANTSNGDFLIDRHPDRADVWLVGGGSGHGFKHGPAVGEYVASQILGTAPAEPRFSLASKAETLQRTVY